MSSPGNHHRIVIVGSGFAGPRQRHPAQAARRARLRPARARRRHWAAPGATTPTPAVPATCPRTCTRSRSPSTPTGRACAHPRARSRSTCERVADEYGIPPHIRFGHEVLEAAWDDERALWEIRTSAGELHGRDPDQRHGWPQRARDTEAQGPRLLPGHDVPLRPVGSRARPRRRARGGDRHRGLGGPVRPRDPARSRASCRSSSAPRPGSCPAATRAISPRVRGLFKRFPPAMRLAARSPLLGRRAARPRPRQGTPADAHPASASAKATCERQVTDPELRAKLKPDFRLGCKRILFTDRYLPTLTKPNVEVVNTPIREVRAHSIVTEDGSEREVDTIIFGTGFHVTDQPLIDRVRGKDGRLLAEHWDGTMAAFNGTTVTGFPNLFILLGPYTGLGHTSIVIMIEAQIEYVMKALDAIEATAGSPPSRCVREAQREFVAEMNRTAQGTVWTAGGCQSWYLDAHGNASTIWPDFTFRFRRRTEPLRHGRLRSDSAHRARTPGPHPSNDDRRGPRMSRKNATPFDVNGRTVFITGAARGIGAESARRLHGKGANVALVGLEPERLEELAAQLGDRAAAFEADVTDIDALQRAVGRHGRALRRDRRGDRQRRAGLQRNARHRANRAGRAHPGGQPPRRLAHRPGADRAHHRAPGLPAEHRLAGRRQPRAR